MRPGTTGRLAGQQAALQQQQYLQQQNNSSVQSQNMNTSTSTSTSKMTIPQAITLITLRLGRLENQLSSSESNTSINGSSLENALVESILQRLDALEQFQSESSEDVGSGSSVNLKNNILEEEIVKIKQQLETCKLGVTSLRSTTTVSSKDLKTFKSELDALKIDFFHTKNLIEDLQVVYDNKNENLLEVDYADNNNNETLSSHMNFQNVNSNSNSDTELETIVEVEETHPNDESVDLVNNENNESVMESELVNEPSSLKEIIQQELKQSGVYIEEPSNNTSNTNSSNKKQGRYNKNK
jgi:hypothetical protein